VKYHLGASSDREFDNNKVHLSLTANPSHLEIVDPVVLGKARAKQDQLGRDRSFKVLPLLIHGDAALQARAWWQNAFGLSGLKGHRTGGSLHFIINNQIGFTTNANLVSRSSPYPSDVAKMIEAPIFHVNGDDPEAVVYAAKVATEFRQTFGQAGGHRHVLLSPLRPQRGGRAGVYPADHVSPHCQAHGSGRALCRAADRRRHDQ
jgi:2-oxoglutarate dehydrogenase E1 component